MDTWAQDVTVQDSVGPVAYPVLAHGEAAMQYDGESADMTNPDQTASSFPDVTDPPEAVNTNELAVLLGPFWSATKTQTALGVGSRQTMASRRRRGALLGLRTSDKVTIYPVWQFHLDNGVVAVRPALALMLGILKHYDPWAVGLLLRTPAPELEGLTPLAWVRAGRSNETLSQLARTVAREWSADGV